MVPAAFPRSNPEPLYWRRSRREAVIPRREVDAMQIGLCLPHYGRVIEPDRLLQVVQRAEARGLDALWVTDHVIVPTDVHIIYRTEMLDPLAMLPWLAGVTERIALGTSVLILPYRSPLPAAKLLASVDVLSGGRLIFGAGVGWMEGEFAALGVPFRERGRRTDEALELIRAVWAQPEPALETRGHHLRDVVASPMPIQKPRPPIWIGGGSAAAFARVARYGDGWHATAADPDTFRQGAEHVGRAWATAGRAGAPVLSLRVPFWLDELHRPAADMSFLRGRHAVHGSVRDVVEMLRAYARLGCRHAALDVSLTTYPAILETIDVLAAEVRPALRP
jgi:probable F420-dependent oxidoreductase